MHRSRGCQDSRQESPLITSHSAFLLPSLLVFYSGDWQHHPRVAQYSGQPTTTNPTLSFNTRRNRRDSSTISQIRTTASHSRLGYHRYLRPPLRFFIGSCSGKWNWAGQPSREAAIAHGAGVHESWRGMFAMDGCDRPRPVIATTASPLAFIFSFPYYHRTVSSDFEWKLPLVPCWCQKRSVLAGHLTRAEPARVLGYDKADVSCIQSIANAIGATRHHGAYTGWVMGGNI